MFEVEAIEIFASQLIPRKAVEHVPHPMLATS